MKIELVYLENIRSHVKSTIPFAKGFNCLVGGLGCGKSSILYAIDFAFFGDPLGRSYEYLLRENAESGKVTVHFVQNGKHYKLTRGLWRHGKGISQDFEELKFFENENLIASMKSEAVAEQFKAITGLDKDLFREIVWIRQEHLKELLDATSRDRQKRLDALFGLSDYEIAWSNLLNYQKEYEGVRNTLEKDPEIAGLDKLSVEYNKSVEEFSLIELELQEITGKLASAQKTLEEADLKLRKLEKIKIQVEELKRKETQLQANLMNVEDSLAALAEKSEKEKNVIDGLKQRIASLKTQIDSVKAKIKEIGIPSDQPVEALKQHLTAFDDQISSLKGERDSALKGMREDQKRVSELSAHNRCPLCLQPLNDEYKSGLLQRISIENNERQKTINQLQREIEELQQIKNMANNALSGLQTLYLQLENLEINLKKEEESLSTLLQEFSEKQKLERELHFQLENVRRQISQFDICEIEEARAKREEAFKHYYSLKTNFQVKENRKQDLARRLNELKERIDHSQQKIERLQEITRIIEIINVIRSAYRSIQPKLRSEFVKILRNFVQQILDNLVGGEGSLLNISIDETYTPYIKSESGVEREVSNLSGGERTLLAFAYRLGLGQLIMQSKSGHGLSMLLLDEPTESLGREDGSIDRLAEAISRFKAVEQIIAVTHSEAFAEKAEHVIRLEKEAGASKVSVEK